MKNYKEIMMQNDDLKKMIKKWTQRKRFEIEIRNLK